MSEVTRPQVGFKPEARALNARAVGEAGAVLPASLPVPPVSRALCQAPRSPVLPGPPEREIKAAVFQENKGKRRQGGQCPPPPRAQGRGGGGPHESRACAPSSVGPGPLRPLLINGGLRGPGLGPHRAPVSLWGRPPCAPLRGGPCSPPLQSGRPLPGCGAVGEPRPLVRGDQWGHRHCVCCENSSCVCTVTFTRVTEVLRLH